jgi:RHS repeat-associated protein
LTRNPWQYAGKRVDQETGFSAFGLCYYDPSIGRWLTPDPAGFADGPNLYAYVHNSPLLYWDQFGLFANSFLSGLYENPVIDFVASGINKLFFGLPSMVKTSEITHVSSEARMQEEYRFRNQENCQRTKRYDLNKDGIIDPSTNAPFQLKEAPNKGIGLVNGIMNTQADFEKSMQHLGQMSEYNVQGVHCPTRGLLTDLWHYFKARFCGTAYEGVREIHNMLDDFFQNASHDATFLLIGHSRGVVYIRNALMSYPPELRQRIEVLAVAPGEFIDPALCKSVTHLVSKGDPIPHIADHRGLKRFRDTIVSLDPHRNASKIADHSFCSDTYKERIEKTLEKYSAR